MKIQSLLFAATLMPFAANAALTIPNLTIDDNGVGFTKFTVDLFGGTTNPNVFVNVSDALFGSANVNGTPVDNVAVLHMFEDGTGATVADGLFTADEWFFTDVNSSNPDSPSWSLASLPPGFYMAAVSTWGSVSGGNATYPTPAEVIAENILTYNGSADNTYTLTITGQIVADSGAGPVPVDVTDDVITVDTGAVDPCIANPTLPGCSQTGGGPGSNNGTIPEPTTLALLGLGLAGLGAARRRKSA